MEPHLKEVVDDISEEITQLEGNDQLPVTTPFSFNYPQHVPKGVSQSRFHSALEESVSDTAKLLKSALTCVEDLEPKKTRANPDQAAEPKTGISEKTRAKPDQAAEPKTGISEKTRASSSKPPPPTEEYKQMKLTEAIIAFRGEETVQGKFHPKVQKKKEKVKEDTLVKKKEKVKEVLDWSLFTDVHVLPKTVQSEAVKDDVKPKPRVQPKPRVKPPKPQVETLPVPVTQKVETRQSEAVEAPASGGSTEDENVVPLTMKDLVTLLVEYHKLYKTYEGLQLKLAEMEPSPVEQERKRKAIGDLKTIVEGQVRGIREEGKETEDFEELVDQVKSMTKKMREKIQAAKKEVKKAKKPPKPERKKKK